MNGVCVYTGTADFNAYGVNYVTFDLNVGSLEGKQPPLRQESTGMTGEGETRSNNNAVQAQFDVKKLSKISVKVIVSSNSKQK